MLTQNLTNLSYLKLVQDPPGGGRSQTRKHFTTLEYKLLVLYPALLAALGFAAMGYWKSNCYC